MGIYGSVNRIPGPRDTWILRRIPALIRDPISVMCALQREFGNIARLRLGTSDYVLLNEPDLIQRVLVTDAPRFEKFPRLPRARSLFGEGLLTSEDPYHLEQRRLMQPAFYHERLAEYAQIIVRTTEEIAAEWQPGEEVELSEEMGRLALIIVGRTLFGMEAAGLVDEVGDALHTVLRGLNRLVLPFGNLLTPRSHDLALARLDEIVHKLIRERRRHSPARTDLLTMLLDMNLTDEQLRDEVMTMFVAGHETTANALTWALYLLSQNPAVEDEVRTEAERLDRRPAMIGQFGAAERAFAESLRLFPSVWILGRRALHTCTLGPYELAAGTVVLVSSLVLHRIEEFWPEPERFDPSRWPHTKAKFTYLPFGAGGRQCIGERFAWLEGILILSVLVRRFQLRLVPGQRIEWQPLMTLRPRFGIRMRIEAVRANRAA